jgi:hypothetical protein
MKLKIKQYSTLSPSTLMISPKVSLKSEDLLHMWVLNLWPHSPPSSYKVKVVKFSSTKSKIVFDIFLWSFSNISRLAP